MFDIGFTELLVIATISLIVIGPERLPETVRAITMWIGRFKRSLRETRREIEQQIGADEIRRELHNEEVMRSLEKIRHDVKADLDEDLADDQPPPPSIQPPAGSQAKPDPGETKRPDGDVTPEHRENNHPDGESGPRQD